MPATFPEGAAGLIASAIRARPADERLTWRRIQELSEPVCGRRPSRVWLSGEGEIVKAYEAHRRPPAPDGEQEGLTPRQRDAATIARLREQLKLRDEKLSEYDERLARYLIRLREGGLTQDYLDRPLEPVRRVRGKRKKPT